MDAHRQPWQHHQQQQQQQAHGRTERSTAPPTGSTVRSAPAVHPAPPRSTVAHGSVPARAYHNAAATTPRQAGYPHAAPSTPAVTLQRPAPTRQDAGVSLTQDKKALVEQIARENPSHDYYYDEEGEDNADSMSEYDEDVDQQGPQDARQADYSQESDRSDDYDSDEDRAIDLDGGRAHHHLDTDDERAALGGTSNPYIAYDVPVPDDYENDETAKLDEFYTRVWCDRWRALHAALTPLGKRAKALRESRKDLRSKIVNNMAKAGIGRAVVAAPDPSPDTERDGDEEYDDGDEQDEQDNEAQQPRAQDAAVQQDEAPDESRYIVVELVDARATASLSDRTLDDAVFQHMSASMARACAKRLERAHKRAIEKGKGAALDALPDLAAISDASAPSGHHRPTACIKRPSAGIDAAGPDDREQDPPDAKRRRLVDGDASPSMATRTPIVACTTIYRDIKAAKDADSMIEAVYGRYTPPMIDVLGAILRDATRERQRALAAKKFALLVREIHSDKDAQSEATMVIGSIGLEDICHLTDEKIIEALSRDAQHQGLVYPETIYVPDPIPELVLGLDAIERELVDLRRRMKALRAAIAAMTLDTKPPPSESDSSSSSSSSSPTSDARTRSDPDRQRYDAPEDEAHPTATGDQQCGGPLATLCRLVDDALRESAPRPAGSGPVPKPERRSRNQAAKEKHARHASVAPVREAVVRHVNRNAKTPKRGLPVRMPDGPAGPGTYRLKPVVRCRAAYVTQKAFETITAAAVADALAHAFGPGDGTDIGSRAYDRDYVDRVLSNHRFRTRLADSIKKGIKQYRAAGATRTNAIVLAKIPTGRPSSK
jgi:hypothetical protein